MQPLYALERLVSERENLDDIELWKHSMQKFEIILDHQ